MKVSIHLLLKLGLRPGFPEQGSNIEYSRINTYGTKAEQFVQMMGFTNSKKTTLN